MTKKEERDLSSVSMSKLISEIKYRWLAKTPIFWKKMLRIAVVIGTSAVAVLGADKLFDLQAYGVPLIVFTIAGYIIVACFALGLAAKITKE